jgi:hypothetical protein
MLETNLAILRDILAEEYDLPPNAIQPEFFDFLKVVAIGARKYAMNNWLEPNGKRSSEKDMADSTFHHLANSFANPRSVDVDTKLDHLLSAMCRCGMLYTRRQRGIIHPEDLK